MPPSLLPSPLLLSSPCSYNSYALSPPPGLIPLSCLFLRWIFVIEEPVCLIASPPAATSFFTQRSFLCHHPSFHFCLAAACLVSLGREFPLLLPLSPYFSRQRCFCRMVYLLRSVPLPLLPAVCVERKGGRRRRRGEVVCCCDKQRSEQVTQHDAQPSPQLIHFCAIVCIFISSIAGGREIRREDEAVREPLRAEAMRALHKQFLLLPGAVFSGKRTALAPSIALAQKWQTLTASRCELGSKERENSEAGVSLLSLLPLRCIYLIVGFPSTIHQFIW